MKDNWDKTRFGIVGLLMISSVSLAIAITRGYSRSEEKMSRYAVYEEFGRIADTNKDGDLTQDELIKAYHQLGLKYDARYPMLDENQMRDYIKLNR